MRTENITQKALKNNLGGFRSCPTINEIIKVDCGASGEATFSTQTQKSRAMHEISIYDVFSIHHVPTLGRTYYRLIRSPNLKIGGMIMHHTFKYGDVLNAENLDKLTENYGALETKIQELEDKLAVYENAKKQTNKTYFTKKSLFINQAPNWNFELDADQILDKALESGFVIKVAEDKYLMNDNY